MYVENHPDDQLWMDKYHVDITPVLCPNLRKPEPLLNISGKRSKFFIFVLLSSVNKIFMIFGKFQPVNFLGGRGGWWVKTFIWMEPYLYKVGESTLIIYIKM